MGKHEPIHPPEYPEIEERLLSLELNCRSAIPEELLVFYHEETLRELCALREYFLSHELDRIDSWLRMVALNRLTGHSSGFFSVYTLPPNQAVSVESQRRINEKRGQVPPRRDVKRIMLKKTKSLLKDCVPSGCRRLPGEGAPWILTASSDATPQIPDESVSLVVTSPPFLDVVDYEQDNWLRSWFAGIDPKSVRITMEKGLAGWRKAMSAVFRELLLRAYHFETVGEADVAHARDLAEVKLGGLHGVLLGLDVFLLEQHVVEAREELADRAVFAVGYRHFGYRAHLRRLRANRAVAPAGVDDLLERRFCAAVVVALAVVCLRLALPARRAARGDGGQQRAVRRELEGLGLYKLLTQRAQLGVVFQRYRDGFADFQRGRTGEAL